MIFGIFALRPHYFIKGCLVIVVFRAEATPLSGKGSVPTFIPMTVAQDITSLPKNLSLASTTASLSILSVPLVRGYFNKTLSVDSRECVCEGHGSVQVEVVFVMVAELVGVMS